MLKCDCPNLTQSEEMDDLSPQWLPEGSGLLFTCGFGSDPNKYRLCRNDLIHGQDELVMEIPVYGLHRIILSPDASSLIGNNLQDGLVQVDLKERTSRVIANPGDWVDRIIFSFDADFASFIHSKFTHGSQGRRRELDQVWVSDLSTGRNSIVFEVESPTAVTWMEWIK